MRQTVFTEHIEKPPMEIWSFIANPENDVRWRREIEFVRRIRGAAGEPGALYREVVASHGAATEVELEIVEAKPGSRLVMRSEGPSYESTATWTIEPYGEGSFVTLRFAFEMRGAAKLSEAVTWSLVVRWLERDLPLLEGHLACLPTGASELAGARHE